MEPVLLNDVHSRLNPCRVQQLALPESSDEAASLISRWPGRVSISGRRHSMGGQSYGAETLCLDTTKLADVLNFDTLAGTVTVECGITWKQLIRFLHAKQESVAGSWGIHQKQSGFSPRRNLGHLFSDRCDTSPVQKKPVRSGMARIPRVSAY